MPYYQQHKRERHSGPTTVAFQLREQLGSGRGVRHLYALHKPSASSITISRTQHHLYQNHKSKPFRIAELVSVILCDIIDLFAVQCLTREVNIITSQAVSNLRNGDITGCGQYECSRIDNAAKSFCNPPSSDRNSRPCNRHWTLKFLFRNT